MSSKVLKCPSCNIVINEVLAFIDNKKDVMDDESLVNICVSAFSESDIETAKNLLFDSVPTKKRKIVRKKDNRKKDGKSLKELDDIICLLRDTHSEDIPLFTARALEKLPPVLWDHVDVTRILKDIVKMQRDISLIMNDCAKQEDLDRLKSEVDVLKETSVVNNYGRNVNLRRGGFLRDSFECQSGPMGLPPLSIEQHNDISLRESVYRDIGQELNSSEGSRISPLPDIGTLPESHETAVTMTHTVPSRPSQPPLMPTAENVNTDTCVADASAGHTAAASGQPNHPIPVLVNKNLKTDVFVTNSIVPSNEDRAKSMSEIVREGNWKSEVHGDQWIQVQRKKLRNRFSGYRGKAILEPGDNFKAAEINVPLYIYNVAKGVSVSDINDYIKKKSKLNVNVEKMKMKTTKDYESYKIFVPKYKLDLFMTDTFWPEGVAYRRFIDFKYREKGSAVKAGVKNLHSK